MQIRHLLLASALLAVVPGLMRAESSNQPAATRPTRTHDTAASESGHQNEGDRIFQQNCSRCHNAPEGFPPSISGTVVRHMRVRASLSHHDEEELLRFLNP